MVPQHKRVKTASLPNFRNNKLKLESKIDPRHTQRHTQSARQTETNLGSQSGLSGLACPYAEASLRARCETLDLGRAETREK